jgi:hypothetical protein
MSPLLMNPSQRIELDTRQAFQAAIIQAVVGAAVEGRREMIWVDPDFVDWPLEDAALLDAMTRWSRQPMRRLLVVAQNFQDVPRRHPRFTRWRTTYSHRIECRSAPELSAREVPCLMLAGDFYSLQLLDKSHWQGRWLDDETDRKTWHDVVEAILQRSEGDFPASTLGL